MVLAAGSFDYTPMETIPGFGNPTDFPAYVLAIYKFGIWTASICALIMIVIGGYMYAASGGNNASMEKAKGFITDAIIGLILALLAYLIIYIINPELIKIKMAAAIPTTPTTTTPITSNSLKDAATALSANTNVNISNSGDCKDAKGTTVSPSSSLSQAKNGLCSTTCNATCKSSNRSCGGCVSTSTKLLDALNTIGKNTSISVSSLTGGEHTSASDHYSGKAADVVPSANKSEWSAIVSRFKSAGCSKSFCDKGGTNVSCSSADHIHVSC